MLEANSPNDQGDDIVSLGSLLKKNRSRLGLTQKETAERASIGLSYYKQLETDRASPTLDKLKSLSRALEIDPRAMFENDDDDPPDPDDPQFDDGMEKLSNDAHMVADALLEVRNIFNKRPSSRRLPPAILQAENTLMASDIEELEAAAASLGLDIGVEFPGPEAIADLSPVEHDLECGHLSHRLIVAAMYGDAFEGAGREELEAIANDIRDRVYRGRSFIQSKGFFEDEDVYLERLRCDLAPHAVEAAKQRLAPDLDSLFDDEEND